MSRQLQADLALALVTFIWGSTFVVVKNELASIGPMAFVAVRFAFAFIVMAVLARRSLARMDRHSVKAGALIGVFLFGGYGFQTVGLAHTTASNAAFITGLCVVLAPLFSRLWLGQAPSHQALLGVALATAGLGFLSLNESLIPSYGDLLVLACAASFALHIVAIGRYAPRMDPLGLTTVQIGVVALAGTGAAALTEPFPPAMGMGTLGVALVMGVVATAFAFTVQNRVQVFTTPTHTALVLSLEPVFGALSAHLLAGEQLGERQLLGCALILAGMLVAELRSAKPCPSVPIAARR